MKVVSAVRWVHSDVIANSPISGIVKPSTGVNWAKYRQDSSPPVPWISIQVSAASGIGHPDGEHGLAAAGVDQLAELDLNNVKKRCGRIGARFGRAAGAGAMAVLMTVLLVGEMAVVMAGLRDRPARVGLQ